MKFGVGDNVGDITPQKSKYWQNNDETHMR